MYTKSWNVVTALHTVWRRLKRQQLLMPILILLGSHTDFERSQSLKVHTWHWIMQSMFVDSRCYRRTPL